MVSIFKPKEVVTKDVLEFEEDNGVLHVKELKEDQVQADNNLLIQLPVPVEVNVEVLTPAQCERLAELLSKHIDVFSRDDQDYGYTTAVVHDIPTSKPPPIKQHHRRVPPQIFQEVKRHVQNLVSQGIHKESSSPWASPAVIFMKKDGSVRFTAVIIES